MSDWTNICKLNDILPNSGRAALYKGQQVAIFRVRQGQSDSLYAVGNYCPFSHANVVSRGIVGSVGDEVVIASPIYKQRFCLQSGRCLEDEDQRLPVWKVQLAGDNVQLAG